MEKEDNNKTFKVSFEWLETRAFRGTVDVSASSKDAAEEIVRSLIFTGELDRLSPEYEIKDEFIPDSTCVEDINVTEDL